MIAVQCPKCELRFASRNAAAWHPRQDQRRSTGLGLRGRLHQSRHARRSQREQVTDAAWLRCS
jgi:hypothetical protein